MKKTLLTLLIFFTLCISTDAQMLQGIVCGGAAGGACDPASKEVGDRTEYATEGAITLDECYAHLYTPDCSGSLGTGSIYNSANSTGLLKVCVYTDSGDGVPNDTGDVLVGCTDEITVSPSPGWHTSAGKIAQTVSTTASYWVVILAGELTKPSYGAGTGTIYYGSCGSGSYASPPANLGALSLSAAANSGHSVYVTVE